MESIQLNIKGMKCGGCVSTVENILRNSDGIENVSVNLLTESAYCEINSTFIEIDKVLENLKQRGPDEFKYSFFNKDKIFLCNTILNISWRRLPLPT